MALGDGVGAAVGVAAATAEAEAVTLGAAVGVATAPTTGTDGGGVAAAVSSNPPRASTKDTDRANAMPRTPSEARMAGLTGGRAGRPAGGRIERPSRTVASTSATPTAPRR